MSGLDAFLLARIAEDKAMALAAARHGSVWADGGPGSIEGARVVVASDGALAKSGRGVAEVELHALPHLLSWDPDRVLAECEAKRRIVEAYREVCARRDIYQSADARAVENDEQAARRRSAAAKARGLEIVLEALVLPHAGHVDYDEEWRP